MYIISKQKDYYDGVVGTVGIDKTIVYEREMMEIEEYKEFPTEFRSNQPWRRGRKNHFLNLNYHSLDKNNKYQQFDSFIIGFCGKLYLGWKFHWEQSEKYHINPVMHTDFVYGYKDAKHFFNPEGYWGNMDDDVNYVLNFDPMDLFRRYNTPIFLYDSYKDRIDLSHYWKDKSRFIINPILKEYKFYRIVDAVTAFQEIQMFISGVLGTGEKEIVEVEDKYKIAQHGFDKWSFRKEPEKK